MGIGIAVSNDMTIRIETIRIFADMSKRIWNAIGLNGSERNEVSRVDGGPASTDDLGLMDACIGGEKR